MRKIISILLIVCAASCNEVNTEDETNAVQEVLNFYGGECLKNKGLESLNGATKKYFEIEISKSELLDAKPQNIKSHSANIAHLFYSNLNTEKENYDDVRVRVILSNGSEEAFKYSSEELKEIQKIQPLLKDISETIVATKYGKLALLFDEGVQIDTSSVGKLFNDLEKQHGSITKLQFQGLEFRETNNFGNVMLIKQAIVFTKVSLSMNIVLRRDNNKIISIEFD